MIYHFLSFFTFIACLSLSYFLSIISLSCCLHCFNCDTYHMFNRPNKDDLYAATDYDPASDSETDNILSNNEVDQPKEDNKVE